MVSIFYVCLLAICMSSLEKCLSHILWPLFSWVIWSFDSELYEFFVHFGYWSPVKYIICKYFLSSKVFICWWFLSLCKSLLVWCSPICLFLFLFPLRRHIQKILLRPVLKILLPGFYSGSFMASGLIFKSLSYFEFICVHDARK